MTETRFKIEGSGFGSGVTIQEIAQQPELWLETLNVIENIAPRLDAFLAPLLANTELRIILTGAGTSAFIGEVAAPALSRSLARRVDAVATTDIVSNPFEFFSADTPTLLVSFARSGNSPESVAATQLADKCLSSVYHLVITCDETGALALAHRGQLQSFLVITPARANDVGFAMTSSFTTMLLLVLNIFDILFDGDRRQLVAALAYDVNEMMLKAQTLIHRLPLNRYFRIVYLGSGSLTGLAREAALKLLELTAGRIVTFYDSSLGFRHGPKAIIDANTLVVVFVSSNSYTRKYDLDIIAELKGSGAFENVVAIDAGEQASEQVVGAVRYRAGVTAVPGRTVELDDAYLAMVYVVFAQLLGIAFALQVGTTPDNPFPAGNVNRVVKGVVIHELDVN